MISSSYTETVRAFNTDLRVPSDNPLLPLIALQRRARTASAAELPFLAVNETRLLAEYRQAALYLDHTIRALSGLAQPDLNAPYVQWLTRLCVYLRDAHPSKPAALTSRDIPPDLAAQWGEWLPAFLLWIPLSNADAMLLARAAPWDDASVELVAEWAQGWEHAWRASQPRPSWSFARVRNAWQRWWRTRPGQPWWRQPRVCIGAAIAAVLLFPIRLSVLAPAELVAAQPEVIRAPLDGVIGQFHVEPNQRVAAGQLLFEFDAATLRAQVEIAAQTLATAEAEYRQNASLAVSDARSKAQLAALVGKIEEKRAELVYLQGQIERASVTAPQAGVVVFDDVSEWVGRPVQTGERILRIADPRAVEIEAWLALGDALPFPAAARVQMYPSATPLHSLAGTLRYVAFEAQARPDGNYAYRLRAALDTRADAGDAALTPDDATFARLGQKGTARIYSQRVPLIYWMLRRPLAAIRQYLGV